jgi:transcriptional regulator with XRE-family HTH domain
MADELARLLRMTRARQGLTLRTAEEATGVTKETISELERGLRIAQMPTLARLAEGYNLDLETVLTTAGLLPVEGEPEPSIKKEEAPPSPGPAVEEPVDGEWRALYRSAAELLKSFCDEWEDRLDRRDYTLDTLKEFWDQSIGMVPWLNLVWGAEWTQLRRERGEGATMFDTTLYPSMDRFMALQDRYQRLLDEQAPAVVSVPDELAIMRQRRRRAG